MTDILSTSVAGLRGPGLTDADRALVAAATDAVVDLAAQSTTVNALAIATAARTIALGDRFATNDVLGPGVSAVLIGQVPRDCDFASLTLPVVAAGNLRLIRVAQVSDARFNTIEGRQVTLATANADNTVTVANLQRPWPFKAGDWIGYQAVGAGSATIGYSNASPGFTGLGLFTAADGVQDWIALDGRRFAGTATFSYAVAAVGTPAIAPELDARIQIGEAVAPVARAAQTVIGGPFAYDNDPLTGAAAFQIGAVGDATRVIDVTLPVAAPGPLNLLLLRPAGDLAFTVVTKVPVTALATGDVTFGAGALGAGIAVQAGDVIGYELLAGGASVKKAAGSALGRLGAATGTQPWSVYPYRYGGRFTAVATTIAIAPKNVDVPLARALSNPATTLTKGFGGGAPAGWAFGGAWTYPAGGMLSPAGAADMTVFAKLAQPSMLHDEDRVQRWVIQPAAAGCKVALGLWRSNAAPWSGRGTLVIIDDAARTLSFARANSGGADAGDQDTSWTTPPTAETSTGLPALVAGRDYLVELSKDRRINRVSIRDLASGVVVATLADGTNDGMVTTQSGYQFGSPIVVAMAGQVLVRRFHANSRRARPRVAFLTDSIGEVGNSEGGVAVDQRWTQLTKDALGGNAVLLGIAGSRSNEIGPLLQAELPAIAPDWIISAFGTNDQNGNLAAFQASTQALIDWCAASAAQLAIARIQPVPGRSFDQLNAYIDTLPQSVRRIRFDLALTSGGDGVTFNPAVYGADQLHPNPAGHALMAARVRIDLPEIFDLAG